MFKNFNWLPKNKANPKCPVCKGTGLVAIKGKPKGFGPVQVGKDHCSCVLEKAS
jgi:hypothetical protein